MKLNWTTIVNISRPLQSIICILKAAIQIDSVSLVECGRGARGAPSAFVQYARSLTALSVICGARRPPQLPPAD